MQKEYVSILELLADNIQYLNTNKAKTITYNIGLRRPYFYNDAIDDNGRHIAIFNRLPAGQKTDNKPKTTSHPQHPLDALRETLGAPAKDGDTEKPKPDTDEKFIRLSTVFSLCSELRENVTIHMPYILELEFLKNSEFSLCGEEQDMLYQMMVMQVITWGLIEMGHQDVNIHGDYIRNALKASGKLYELDLDKDPGIAAAMVKNAYKKFTPMDTSYSSYWDKMHTIWYVAPRSMDDALRGYIYNYDTGAASHYYRETILYYMPLIMTFFLLEKETEKFQAMTYENYAVYKDRVDKIKNIFSMEYKDFDPDTVCRNFSYGFMGDPDLDDEAFLYKVFTHISNEIQTVVFEKNTPCISLATAELSTINKFKKVSVRLNSRKLSWDRKETDHGQNI